MIKTDQFINDVRQLISEPNSDNSFFSDGLIISAINRGLYKINRALKIPQAIIYDEFDKNTQEIALPNYVQNIISVNLDNKNNLRYFTYDTYLQEIGIESEVGMPERYYIREHYDDSISDSILVLGFDKKFDKKYNIYIQIVHQIQDLNSITDNIPLPKDLTLALQNAVLAEIYDKDNKGEKAIYYRRLFDEEIAELKTKFFNRVPSYVK